MTRSSSSGASRRQNGSVVSTATAMMTLTVELGSKVRTSSFWFRAVAFQSILVSASPFW